METYIITGTYSSEGESIEDFDFDTVTPGSEWTEKALEAVGGKLLHHWSTLGRFDFLVVIEVPNTDAVRAFVTCLGAKTETMRAFDNEADISGFVNYAKKVQATMKK
jgi:uncharacterized protein with GYD domain